MGEGMANRSSGVPGEADEEATIVAEVGGPPVLRVGHQGVEVLLEGLIVEALEGGGIVKVSTERVVGRGVLAEDVKREGIRDELGRGTAASDVGVVEGALLLGHGCEELGRCAVESRFAWECSGEAARERGGRGEKGR